MEVLLVFCIIITAFLYASVGHGGASGYLAVMALFSVSAVVIKPTALILNLVVSGMAFFHYYKAGYFRYKLLLPFIFASVPAAFLGAKITLDPRLYKIILGIALLIAVFRLLLNLGSKEYDIKPCPKVWAVVSGFFIGLFSGMIGIGGGIILSPLLILNKWAKIKETSALSAAFIFLNSLSGLIGTENALSALNVSTLMWISAALVGGMAGAYFGSRKAPVLALRLVLSFVLVYASIKLIIL